MTCNGEGNPLAIKSTLGIPPFGSNCLILMVTRSGFERATPSFAGVASVSVRPPALNQSLRKVAVFHKNLLSRSTSRGRRLS